jgi:HK97 family phage major capsid protein
MSFATVEIGAHKVGGIIKASTEIIQDSQFDIASEIITEFGIAFEDKDEIAFLLHICKRKFAFFVNIIN